MKKYIVGGFCRDKLLGIQPKDKDYVLVGAKNKDIQYLLSIGYQKVGADFPVFLSPDGNEYSLARTERKSGTGYNGFDVQTEGVTLEQDLFRRDLTINAIAYDPVLKLHFDPYNGKTDLKNKVLRHVSVHFKEDPLRVLRLARFATRYSDFTVHDSTLSMVKEMVDNGELSELTPERVYVEFEKAFSEEKPSIFIKKLFEWNILGDIIPNYKCTKKSLELIDEISSKCTDVYKDYFIWSVLLEKETNIGKDYVINGRIKLPSRFVKFSKFIESNKLDILSFRKKEVIDMVNLFSTMNIRNNGGEEFLYKVLEYFILRKEIDLDLEDLIIKVYDRYEGTEVGNIEEMVSNGDLKPADIRSYVLDLRTENVKKMF